MNAYDTKNLLEESSQEEEQDIPIFLRLSGDKSFKSRKSEKVINYLNRSNDGGHYTSRCNISLMSNYLLYLVFISQTVAFNYFAFFAESDDGRKPCLAAFNSNDPVPEGAGRDISDRFNKVLYIGSICGILELLRNTLNLWAKCFNH